MQQDLVISHPHMGSYAVVIRQLLRHLFPNAKILTPPPITQKTVELGNKYSPDFVCAPFKFNLGNYIEALEQGANVLLQTGTGCRYGYYGELQEQILKDMGYDFRFYCFSRERVKPDKILSMLREIGCDLPIQRILKYCLLAVKSVHLLDHYEYWMRENVGFETQSGACERVWKKLLKDIENADTNAMLVAAQRCCKDAVEKIEFNRPENPLKVGIVGELYTLMEPFSTFELEKKLANEGIVVSRCMSVWYLLFGSNKKQLLNQCGCYLDYRVGANGVDSVAQSLSYAKNKYDGILHLKSFGCIPELNATPALMNLAHNEKIPVLELSFDMQTSEAGVQTRLEAFSDMLRMRREAQ